MQEVTIQIVNERGLHARAAARFVHVASGFDSSVRVLHGDEEADGKSILSLMVLGAACGSELRLQTEGKDEVEALQALTELVGSGFDE